MLRLRINSGFLSLLIIVLAMGLFSIDRCTNLGMRIENILQENYETIAGIQELKRSSSRMTALLLQNAASPGKQTQADFALASQRFAIALEKQEQNGRSSEEKAAAKDLREEYTQYLKDSWIILKAKPPAAAQLKAVTDHVGIETARLEELVDSLLDAHEKVLRDHNAHSGEETTLAIRLFILTMILASVLTLYLSMRATKWILNPLTHLAYSIGQVGEGNLDQYLPSHSTDELGMLAASFNQMALKLKNFNQSNSEKLLRLDQTMRKTLTSFPDPIFVLNGQGAIEFRNPSADSLAVKLLFAGIARLPEQVQDLVAEVLRSGQDYLPTTYKDSIKFQFNNADVYYMPRVILLTDDQGTAFGAAVILEDITRMHLLDVMKSNLVSTVSHELKTPLTGLRMAIYLLQEQSLGQLNANQIELVTTAKETTDRMLGMLNDFLNLTRLEEGVPNLNLENITPRDLVSMVIAQMEPLASASNIQIAVDVDPELPPILADPQRIVYVFNNILGNAIKYSPASSKVLVRAQLTDENQVRFLIRDQGPGIPPEYHSRLFEKFYRVPGSQKSGSGLGLAIAREIVVAHGGEIGLRSSPGEGSEFFFILPSSGKPEIAAQK